MLFMLLCSIIALLLYTMMLNMTVTPPSPTPFRKMLIERKNKKKKKKVDPSQKALTETRNS